MALVRYRLDPNNPPRLTPEQEARLDAMTDEELTRAAESDPDNPPLTDDEFVLIHTIQILRRLRKRLGLSQAQFAERFHINLARLRDWEQGRHPPDSVALAYLRVIEHDPEGVARVLAAAKAA
jgi:putative transcriptional regulator